MLKSKSLKFKLLSWGIGSILIVSTFLILNSSSRLYDSLYSNVKLTSMKESETASHQISERLNDAFAVARHLGQVYKASITSGDKFKLSRTESDEILKQTIKEDKSLLGVWTLWEPNKFDGKDSDFKNIVPSDKTGRYIPYWTRGENDVPQVEALVSYEVEGDGDYYQLAKKLRKEVILEPYIYKVNGVDTLITSLVVPIIINDTFYGVAGVDISLDFFQGLASQSNIYDKQGDVFIFSHTGIVAGYSADKKLVNTKLKDIKVKDYTPADKKRFTANTSVHVGDFNISTIVPLNIGHTGTPWFIETIVPNSVVYKEVKSSILSLVMWGSVMAVLLAVFGAWSLGKINNTLSNISDELKTEAEKVLNIAFDLGNISSELSSATEQQSTSLQETSSSISEITAMVERSSTTASSTTKLSSDSQTKAQQGKNSANNVRNKIDEINRNNENLVNSVESNNQEVENIIRIIEEISDKTKVINDIVFQTKLLSFNASVEAARAGEHGKGFSVVAEEVGALAQMSGSAATEISELLERSAQQVRDTVQSSKDSMNVIINEGSQKVEESLQEIEVCNGVLEEIVSSFQQVNRAVEDIASSSSEQSSGVNEITNAIHQLNEVTQQNTSVARDSSSKADDLKFQSEKLAKIVDEIQEVVFGETDSNKAA
jgi:methyl-accepting chemotaxis protein